MTDPLNITFDDFGIRILCYMVEFSCKYVSYVVAMMYTCVSIFFIVRESPRGKKEKNCFLIEYYVLWCQYPLN